MPVPVPVPVPEERRRQLELGTGGLRALNRRSIRSHAKSIGHGHGHGHGHGIRYALGAAVVAAVAACNGSPRDATEHTTDVRVDASAEGTYAYVAQRPRVAIGIAEARGTSEAEAKALVDRLADGAARCMEGLAKDGKLVDGALRMVMSFDGGGIGAAPEVVFAPGPAVTANGLLCVVAPARMLALAPNDGGARALAVEVAWGSGVGTGGGSSGGNGP